MIRLRRIHANDFKQLQAVDLPLPPRGSFLVQGPNESGKSTLFEVVFVALFGRPLAAETAHARLDDVVRYGADEAQVELTAELADGRTMRISRLIRKGRPNVWELDLVAADTGVEAVRGNAVVNQRIEDELGFDAEALLNTCFVEQKKLEKLEGLNRSQREASLMKLLNLDRLVEIEDALRVRLTDRQRVERLRGRALLAGHRAELPGLEADLVEVESALARLEARDAVREVLAQAQDQAAIGSRLEAARRLQRELAARAQAAATAASGLAALRDARTSMDRAAEAEAAATKIELELARARAARDVVAPQVVARGRAVSRLKSRLGWLSAWRTRGRCSGARSPPPTRRSTRPRAAARS